MANVTIRTSHLRRECQGRYLPTLPVGVNYIVVRYRKAIGAMEETSARAMAGMEQYPDTMELRARYDRAAAMPLAQLADGLVFLTGLYLAISPWVVGFDGMRTIAASNLITGVALALVGAGLASAYGRTHGMAWVAPIVGIWTIITPWVISGSVTTTATIASNVATGSATCVGAAAMSIAVLSRR